MDITLLYTLAPFSNHFAVGPRIGKKSIGDLKGVELTHVWTLLSENEDATRQKKFAETLKAKWVWSPLSGGKVDYLETICIEDVLRPFMTSLDDAENKRVYLHCSAGIHRTGFVAALVMALQGLSILDIFTELRFCRDITAESVGEDRVLLAHTMAHAYKKSEKAL